MVSLRPALSRRLGEWVPVGVGRGVVGVWCCLCLRCSVSVSRVGVDGDLSLGGWINVCGLL